MNGEMSVEMMLLQTILGTVVGGVIGWIGSALKTKSQKLAENTEQEQIERKQNRDMLGELLYYRIEDLYRRYVVKGEPCSVAEQQQVEDVYKHYHDELGLNGPGTRMYKEIMDLHQND